MTKTKQELAKEYAYAHEYGKFSAMTNDFLQQGFIAGWNAAMTNIAQEIANENSELINEIINYAQNE